MYALKPPTPTQLPVRVKRVVRKVKARKQSDPHRTIAYEVSAKLVVNVVLSMAAVTALVQLLPYRAAQVGKIQELDAALQSTDNRVEGVQARFQNFFDPYQARQNMQDLTDRIDPLQRRVIWKAPAPATSPQKAAIPANPPR